MPSTTSCKTHVNNGNKNNNTVADNLSSDARTIDRISNSHDDVVELDEDCRPIALITGINGQVGSYLAEWLISKGYMVHGMIRRESSLSSIRLIHLYDDKVNYTSKDLQLHYGDLTDSSSIFQLISTIGPDEVYNLAAQSHVKISFEMPEMTGNTNALGTLRLLDAIRKFELSKLSKKKVRFYQASTSELFGGSLNGVTQNEETKFHPRSPYGCAKLYAHSLVVNYRESYSMFAVNGILFNHESPRRGENFVTRKISRSIAEIHLGHRTFFELGNLDACRDWGHAKDYVEAMWLMLQQDIPKDYVIASGESHSVREFVVMAFDVIGKRIHWQGKGLGEVGKDDDGIVRVKVSEKFFRPADVDSLLGDSSLARRELKWSPKISFQQLVEEMVLSDIKLLTDRPYLW